MTFRIAAFAATLCLLAAALPGGAQPSPGELRLSTASGPTLPLGRAAERWRELGEPSTRGITVKVYPGATLAQRDPLRELLALKQGGADLAVGSALAWSMQVPALMVFALPWIAPDSAALEAVVADAEVRKTLADQLAAEGIVLLAIAPFGHRDIATLSRLIRDCHDLAGMRLRVLAHPMLTDLYSALGANAFAMGYPEAQAAFAQGGLDGEDAPVTALVAARIAGARFVAITGGTGDAILFAMRREAWSRLDDAQQQGLRGAAEQTAHEIDIAAADESALVQLRRQGIAATRFGSASIAQCRGVSQRVFEKWSDPVGRELVARAQAVAARGQPAAR